MKVFCTDCKWFRNTLWNIMGIDSAKCQSPDAVGEDTWHKPRGRRIRPEKLNEKNDCSYFSRW